MRVTPAASVTLVRPVQLKNAEFPTVVTLPGMLTLVRLVCERTHCYR